MTSIRAACIVAWMCMVVVSAPRAEAAISCGTVVTDVSPCISYLQSGPGPSPECCARLKRLDNAAATTPDRKTVCNCLKIAAGSITGLIPSATSSLSGKCGVYFPYEFSTSANCNTIS